MRIDERRRHGLHEAARRSLGDEPALTLMEMLPPVGWADVTTKGDLDHLEARLRTEIARLGEQTRADLAGLQVRLMLWFVGTAIGIVGATGLLRAF